MAQLQSEYTRVGDELESEQTRIMQVPPFNLILSVAHLPITVIKQQYADSCERFAAGCLSTGSCCMRITQIPEQGAQGVLLTETAASSYGSDRCLGVRRRWRAMPKC